MARYIHQLRQWPEFTWDSETLTFPLSNIHFALGKLAGRMAAINTAARDQAALEVLTSDALKTSDIEGEHLNAEQVRSSVARRLGLEMAGLVPSDRQVDGVVEMTLDATQNAGTPLTANRLFEWHAALFPFGLSGNYQIETARWRTGPMQVVSGAISREIVHFEAPAAEKLDFEMTRFFDWFNQNAEIDPVIKSGIAHLWFVTIHPFDDGNGRIARAIADMQLARADGSAKRYYSMSAEIRKRRNEYYEILEKTQKGDLDITAWLAWYLTCLRESLKKTDEILDLVVRRVAFWDKHQETVLNARQRLMILRMQEDFFGKLTSSKWAKMSKTSQDTASRDIQDLLSKGILSKDPAGGRSTSYDLVW
jgi:Fic family protein